MLNKYIFDLICFEQFLFILNFIFYCLTYVFFTMNPFLEIFLYLVDRVIRSYKKKMVCQTEQ